jgi:peptidylprolyl isomerase/peptidyl-prolyl cis-trans isomerase D
MAILSKIRERSMFLILVVGLALFAFVLDPSTISDFFNSTKVNEIGSVNGETISRQEFSNALENYKQQVGSRVSEMQAAKTVWNELVRQKLYKSQLEEAGITVGEADIMQAIYDSPNIQSDQRFLTSGIFDKAKVKEYLATVKEANGPEWKAWQNYMVSLRGTIEKRTYDNLVAAGLGASLKEGETMYMNEGTKVSGKYVYTPFNSISDSLVKVTSADIQKYISERAASYQVESSRDIKFVKFDVTPTSDDEEAIKKEVAGFINNTTNNGQVYEGLKNATDYELFLEDAKSDVALNPNFRFKVEVPQVVAEELFAAKVGDVVGPYRHANKFKISKVTEVTQIPDSVSANHILIPYIGAGTASADTKDTEEQAKSKADSLLAIIKKSPAKFAEFAKEFSSDKSNASKGGELGWFTYTTMVPEFRDFCFENKKGDYGVVKTNFGIHIIEIKDQKNPQNVIKMVTFGRDIVPSDATENDVYQKSSTFTLALEGGKKFDELVEENNVKAVPAVGLKALDENVPGLGKQRSIVTWAFDKEAKVGDTKRFDVEGGYVVAQLTGKTAKGLMPVSKVPADIRTKIENQKKVALIEGKMKGSSLEEIAKSSGQSIRTATDVNLQSPTLSGVGYEPKIVGAMINAAPNKVFAPVVGERGVYAFVIDKRELPTALPNYNTYRKRLANERRNKTYQMYEAIKKASDIDDNVSSFYGITE